MGLLVRIVNVGREERIFRYIIGVILVFLAFFISGLFGWVLGIIGVLIVLTAIFRY
jgi:hypothetical protein